MRASLLRLLVTAALTAVLIAASIVIWTWNPETQTDVVDGQGLFMAKGCSGCHSIGEVGGDTFGPDINLALLADTAASRVEGLDAGEYVRQSVLDPQAFVAPIYEGTFAEMPTLPLTETEVDTLVEFLLTVH